MRSTKLETLSKNAQSQLVFAQTEPLSMIISRETATTVDTLVQSLLGVNKSSNYQSQEVFHFHPYNAGIAYCYAPLKHSSLFVPLCTPSNNPESHVVSSPHLPLQCLRSVTPSLLLRLLNDRRPDVAAVAPQRIHAPRRQAPILELPAARELHELIKPDCLDGAKIDPRSLQHLHPVLELQLRQSVVVGHALVLDEQVHAGEVLAVAQVADVPEPLRQRAPLPETRGQRDVDFREAASVHDHGRVVALRVAPGRLGVDDQARLEVLELEAPGVGLVPACASGGVRAGVGRATFNIGLAGLGMNDGGGRSGSGSASRSCRLLREVHGLLTLLITMHYTMLIASRHHLVPVNKMVGLLVEFRTTENGWVMLGRQGLVHAESARSLHGTMLILMTSIQRTAVVVTVLTEVAGVVLIGTITTVRVVCVLLEGGAVPVAVVRSAASPRGVIVRRCRCELLAINPHCVGRGTHHMALMVHRSGALAASVRGRRSKFIWRWHRRCSLVRSGPGLAEMAQIWVEIGIIAELLRRASGKIELMATSIASGKVVSAVRRGWVLLPRRGRWNPQSIWREASGHPMSLIQTFASAAVLMFRVVGFVARICRCWVSKS